MTDAAAAEFDMLAEWTAEVAIDLGQQFHVPAGCRGSGSPAVLDWLLDEIDLQAGESLLDCGAGVGGPAAYAVEQRQANPVLVEPQAGGCRASRRLFGFPAIQADAAKLPFADETFDATWALGVLCTTEEQVQLLQELRRVARAPGRIGLLILITREPSPEGEPEDSFFPTRESFDDSVARAGLRIETCRSVSDIWQPPDSWQQRVDDVEAELKRRYHDESAWQVAQEQSDRIAGLLKDSVIDPHAFVLRRSD